MIVAAAVKIGEAVVSMEKPSRHHHILRAISGLYSEDAPRPHRTFASEVQGFLTDGGVFLGRREAMSHAISCGQPLTRRDILKQSKPGCYYGPELFSEDLW